MKHHLIDLLYREGNYWTISPNNKRFSYSIKNLNSDNSTKIVTITKNNENWKNIFTYPNLEELTLHEPSQEQLASIYQLINIKRLRVSHTRSKNIDLISKLENIEELVLEYTSGFSDLSQLRNLKKLRSLHIENLCQISNFDGLRGMKSLQYIYIGGTLDRDQTIDNFSFLDDLQNLEVLHLGFIKSLSPYPALQPLVNLKKLKKIKIGMASFPLEEYAFLEANISNVDGVVRTPCVIGDESILMLGKGMRTISSSSKTSKTKCIDHTKKYLALVEEAKNSIINIKK